MADANYRFVLFRRDSDNTVRTNDNDVQNPETPDTWADTRADTPPIDDYTLPILLVEHIPFAPNFRPVGGIEEVNYNGEARVFHHWNDIEAQWHRMPQIIWFDFVDEDGEHLLGATGDVDNPTGAMKLVEYLNLLRGSLVQRPISATGSVAGINQFGWNRADAKVTYTASGDTPLTWVRNAFGAETIELRAGCEDGIVAGSCLASDIVHAEGRTTVSFAAVGNNGLGVRSNQAYVDVKIDRTQPDIACTGNAGSYLADQPVAISCSATDPVSGVQSLSRSTITGLAGELGVGLVAVSVRATDYADNVREYPVTFTVIVTFGSLRNLTERYVANQPLLNVLLNKLDAAAKVDAAGNPVGRAQLLAGYVEQVRKNAGSSISAEQAAVLIRLAQAL